MLALLTSSCACSTVVPPPPRLGWGRFLYFKLFILVLIDVDVARASARTFNNVGLLSLEGERFAITFKVEGVTDVTRKPGRRFISQPAMLFRGGSPASRMENVTEHLNWGLYTRGAIKRWKSRLLSHTLYPVFVYLCLAAVSSTLWCTSTIATTPTPAPAAPPTIAPAPGPAVVNTSLNPTDPTQMSSLYNLTSWPEVWRQKGTVPNITDMTVPNRDPCADKWVGITCNNGTPYQFITSIVLPDVSGGFPGNMLAVMSELITLNTLEIYQKGDSSESSLTGIIPASLGQLKNLVTLNFRGNQLYDQVPPQVASLPLLNFVDLADNMLTGPVDIWCNASNSLKTLLLFDNQFTGDIPSCLGNLFNLTTLNAGANNITGPIPDSFTGLVSLQSLNLDNTTLTGGLSDKLVSAWPQMNVISIRRSNLSGPIPSNLGTLANLTALTLAQNHLSGTIPPELGNLTNLQILGLYENRLTGELPPDIGLMKSLQYLLLGNNSLSGSIPPSFANLSQLIQLHLFGNDFSGPVDGGLFSNMTGLLGLLLHENRFNGTFPSQAVFNSCVNLVNVSVSYNDFTGPVLEPNTVLPNNLSFLLMAYNQLSGPIPPALGQFNSSFTSFSNLKFLDLSNNSLTGNVPPLPNTTQINLSFNSLNVTKQPGQPGYGLFDCNPQDGNCAEYHAGSSKGVAINVGGPALAEYEADVVIPAFSVGMFSPSNTSLWSMSTTGLDGGGTINISLAISNPGAVDYFALYYNARTGADSFTYYVHSLMPGSKYKVELGFVELVDDLRVGERVFDIYIQNNLVYQGMDVMAVAPGQFRAYVQTFEVTTSDNSGLLSIELRGYGSWPLVFNKRIKQGNYYGPTLSALKVSQVHQLSRLQKIGIIIAGLVGGVLIALVILLLVMLYVKKQRKLQAMKEEQASLGLTFYRYSELEAATNKWSDKCLLGEGGFGKVYKGTLSDGTVVAIKQLVAKTDGPFSLKETIMNEAKIISTTRHRNLLVLLGCCFEKDYPIFVTEFVPNGSLHDVLFEHNTALDWNQRVSIAKDVASGLLYLHEETANQIIHRDVKPANILLDERWNARVADFGLARLVAEQEQMDLVTNVMGTRGYLAPEYALNGQLSDKVDVYSYGVVLLELISGRHGLQPSRDLPEPVPVSMVQWAWDLVQDGKVLSIADPQLRHGFTNEDFIRMVEIALWCTQTHPQMRPSMNQVVRMLLKQARVPELVQERTTYEARDLRCLPVNPFDDSKWSSYISEAEPVGKTSKELSGATSVGTVHSHATERSDESFDQTVCPTSGVLAR